VACAPLARAQWRQVAWITVGAVAIFFTLRLLPTGTNLSHMDFRVDAKGANSIEFCDPLNPQFIPVVAARSPVSMAVSADGPVRAGVPMQGTVRLRTSSGKPLAPEDLLVTHTRKLHLLLIDPALGDYQHVHPEPARTPGDWTFSFTPHAVGTYRVFADFTPVATARGLYASVDLAVAGAPEMPAAAATGRGLANASPSAIVEREGARCSLTTAQHPVRAGQPIDLRFAITAANGGAVPLQPVMGAFAHLVAFDETRSGFAHLHPTEVDLLKPPDATHPVLNFKLTIPRAGHYVVWAQINLAGREVFVPFDLPVVE
jgi:hypothetical protein